MSRANILFGLNLLVTACYPTSQEEALHLWHDIKPIRFGSMLAWTIATEYTLASYNIPDDNAHVIVYYVDFYITTPTVTAAGYGLKAPPPSPNTIARWVAAPTMPAVIGNDLNETGVEEPHKLMDTDEFLFFKGGQRISLLANMPANPTADTRWFTTTVYAYLLGPDVADKLGSGESLIQAT